MQTLSSHGQYPGAKTVSEEKSVAEASLESTERSVQEIQFEFDFELYGQVIRTSLRTP